MRINIAFNQDENNNTMKQFHFWICSAFLAIFCTHVSCNHNRAPYRHEDLERWLIPRIKRDTIDIKECAADEFRCDDISCVKNSVTCNGVKDCLNGADETEDACGSHKCKEDEFRCEYGACVNKNVLCDGHEQCADGTDEDWHICQNFTCPPDTFRCVQGICLDKGRLCDGHCTCHSCGDETKELCEHIVCPKGKYQCKDYGGCLDEDMLCDGFPHCRDGADENLSLCGNRTCSENRFRCPNGLCIYQNDLCNGHCHCSDCSDETAELCENKKCPDRGPTFRCDYGACLYEGHVCNGVKNCADNSDEETNMCKQKIPKDQNTCTVPAKTNDRRYTLQCPSGWCEQRPGHRVEQFSRVRVKCANGFFTVNGVETLSSCIAGQWNPPVPRCERKCESLNPINEELACYRNQRSAPISCDSPLLRGSVVQVKCKEGYRPPHNKKEGVYLTCHKDGRWSEKLYKCEPDCGKSYGSSQNLIIHGKAAIVGDSPWHVAIYSTATTKKPELICGATIISENLIVSAAHCFRDDFGSPFKETFFEAVVAKLNRGYDLVDSNQMKRYKIKKIFYPSDDYLHKDFEVYQGDIALLQPTEKITFNKFVIPACLDWTAFESFVPSQSFNGKLVGWGQDLTGKPSNILLAALMPYVSKSNCLDLVNVEFRENIKADKFCAGSLQGAGARPGDSGGGLLFRDVHFNSYIIRGIVSSKDNSNTSLATFTDIGLYLDWIDSVRNEIDSN